MPKICAVTGKRTVVGNNVSHSNRKTKRKFTPNLFKKTLFDPETGKPFKVLISAKGLKTVTRNPKKLLALARKHRK